MHNHGLVNQVIIHADAAQEPGDPVPQELPQGEQRKRGRKNQHREADRVNRPVDHLIHLNPRGTAGQGLEVQHLQQSVKAGREGEGCQRLSPVSFQQLLRGHFSALLPRFLRRFRGYACFPFFLQPDIHQGRQDADHIDIQEVDQLVHHHIVFHQRPEAPGPEAEAHRAQQAEGQRRLFHDAARHQREQHISLGFNGQRPAGGTQRRSQIGIPEKREGEGQMRRHILHQILGAVIQPPGKRDPEQDREDNEIISRQNPPDPAVIELPGIRRRKTPAHGLRVGQEQQEGTEQYRAVHPDVTGTHQVIQVHGADDRRKPALLPDMEPADDENHQHPQAVQFRNPLPFFIHC